MHSVHFYDVYIICQKCPNKIKYISLVRFSQLVPAVTHPRWPESPSCYLSCHPSHKGPRLSLLALVKLIWKKLSTKMSSFLRGHLVPWCLVMATISLHCGDSGSHSAQLPCTPLGREITSSSGQASSLLSLRLPRFLLGRPPPSKEAHCLWSGEEQKSTCNSKEGSFVRYLVSTTERNRWKSELLMIPSEVFGGYWLPHQAPSAGSLENAPAWPGSMLWSELVAARAFHARKLLSHVFFPSLSWSPRGDRHEYLDQSYGRRAREPRGTRVWPWDRRSFWHPPCLQHTHKHTHTDTHTDTHKNTQTGVSDDSNSSRRDWEFHSQNSFLQEYGKPPKSHNLPSPNLHRLDG